MLATNHITIPLRTVNLRSTANTQTNIIVPKQSPVSLRVDAEIKIQIGAVLVRTTHTVLRAKRVTVGRTEVRDHDDDAVGLHAVAAAVSVEY